MSAESKSLSSQLLSGMLWTIAIRWTSKFLGIVSLAICARILSPEDYGLVGMAMVVIGFSNVLAQLGVETSIIRIENPTADQYDSAWSMRIIQGGIVAVIVLGVTPIALSLYKDSRVAPIIIAIGVAGFLGCLENIYSVNYRKQLNFRMDFLLSVLPRFISFVAAVVSVVILRSYWGLVIGICVSEVARVGTSYLFTSLRPKWSLKKWRDFLSFSGWYMVRSVGDFLAFETDRFIIGALGGSRLTGIFSVAKEVASLPSSEIVLPIGRALTPTFALMKNQPARLVAALEKAITGTMIIAAPAALGFALIANEFILLLFGARWMEAVPILHILSIGAVSYGFRDTTANAFVVMGYVRVAAVLSWLQAILVLGLFVPIFNSWGLMGVAWLFAFCSILVSGIYAIQLKRLKLVAGNTLWMGVCRPVLCSLAMFFCVNAIAPTLVGLPIAIVLIVKVLLGVVIYSVALIGLWIAMGRRDSSERVLFDLTMAKIRTLTRPNTRA